MSAEGIEKCEACAESRKVLPEAGDDYEGSEKEVLETMTMYDLCGFDDDDDSKILKKFQLQLLRRHHIVTILPP